LLPGLDPAADVDGTIPSRLVQPTHRAGAASTRLAVHEDVAIGGYLVEVIRQVGERDQCRTGDVHLLPFPWFAHVDEDRITAGQPAMGLVHRRLLGGHHTSP